MSAPAWFDKDVYLVNKLAQLQADEPNNGWDMLKMLEAFNNAGFNPFTDDGIYAHFVAFGNAEGISPNAYFDEGTYFTNKLAQLQATEPDKGWTSVDQVKEAFADAGLSAWDHYTLFGTAEGVSPSKYFDTNAYMKAKLTQMQADDPAYTMTQLQQAFKDADLNPIEHYILFGKNENLSYTPYPVIVDDNKTVVELTGTNTFEVNGKAATELPSEDYRLVGDADELSSAKYEIIAGAKGDVVLKDSVATLVALGADVKEALGLASKVTVEGALSALVQADLPSEITAKSVSYYVSSVDAIAMQDVTVAQATDIDSVLATFLSNPYVTYQTPADKPASVDDVTVTISSVTDTVANLAAADLTQFAGATINVKDTAANINGMTLGLKANVDTVTVADSLANILDMAAPDKSYTFDATDTKNVNVSVDADFNTDFTGAQIHLDKLGENEVVKISLEVADTAINGVTLDATVFKTTADGVTFDITGSALADEITANDLGGIIDGGLGADIITLGAGVDTVVLGSGINSATDLGSANADTITGFSAGASGDKLNFVGILSGFGSKGFASYASGATAASGNVDANGALVAISGSVAIASVSDLFATASDDDAVFKLLDSGESAIVVTNDDSHSYVWYVAEDGQKVGIDDTEVHLVATLQGITDAAKLTADNFA